jgi:hypothetical protein
MLSNITTYSQADNMNHPCLYIPYLVLKWINLDQALLI